MNDYLYKLHNSDRMDKVDPKKQKKLQKAGGIVARNLFPWRYLVVLGLTDCHLCRQSIDLLGVSIYLMIIKIMVLLCIDTKT